MPPREKGIISPTAQRVLLALAKADDANPGEPLPLRRIARRTLAGDAQQAARVLAELDLEGFVRTHMMGWHFGRLTARGKEAVRKLEASKA
jgi:hypothetical protein